jgi:hypothetical protein
MPLFEVEEAWMCPSGELHVWIYLGKDKQQYRCQKCGGTISKARLKEETD